MNRTIPGIYHTNWIVWLVMGMVASLLQGCTDHKTTVPFTFPEYVPQLIVQSAVGPISGAEAAIGWSRPLQGQPGEIPALPNLSVFLLEDEERVNTFIEKADSIGHFTIDANLLTLKENVGYALELLFEETGESLFSETVFLPPRPVIEEVKASVFEHELGWVGLYDISLTYGYIGEGVAAVSMLPILLNDNGNPVEKSSLESYVRADEFRYADGEDLPKRTILKRYSRAIGGSQEEPELAQSVDVRLAYLSPELARFKRDVEKLGYFGENFFQNVRPIYSNINGTVGIFGMYNEASVVVQITEGNNTP